MVMRISVSFAVAITLLVAPCNATVNVVVSTYDGLVIAADSRVTLQDSAKTRVASDYGEKVKQIGSHVAVTFSGAAYLYDSELDLRSIGSIIDQYKSNSSISETSTTNPYSVVLGLDSLFTAFYNAAQLGNVKQGALRLVVCGYDALKSRRIFELTYPQYKKAVDRPFDIYGLIDSIYVSGVPGVVVRGQTDVWTRLMKGYDPRLENDKWFKEVEVTVADSRDSTMVVDTIIQRENLDLNSLRYEIRYELMTLQDAIDFAVFVVRATIEAQRFNQATIQGVGGAIDIAVITSDGFKWIQRKELHGERSE